SICVFFFFFFFSSRRRHTRSYGDWSSDVCSSDLIAGKALGVPVYQLLGGKVRDVIPTKMMIGAFDLPRVRSLAEQFLGWGIRCLKVKVGIDLAGDVARVQAVRELAGPDIPITVDANCGWNVTKARLALEQLRRFNLLVAEQPI